MNVRIATLKSVYGWLSESGQIRGNPASGLKMKKDKIEPRVPLTTDEATRLARACETPMERAIVLLLFGSAIRRSELLGIRPQDVDWIRGSITIRGKGAQQRLTAPGPTAMMALGAFANGAHYGRLFPISKTTLGRMLNGLGERADVHPIYPHRLRVTALCSLLDAGADLICVSVIAGHASVNETRRYQRAVETQRALAQQRRHSLADRIA